MMSGVSVQVGPRSVGRRCAAWGWAVARDRFITVLVIVTLFTETVLTVVFLSLGHAAHHAAPAVFCPAGQHVTGVSASGWPDCAVNR